jgi:DNA-binding CsgD family transcriptional regulator
MLYGVHVFARAKVIPDLAVSRGEEAFRAATEIGDPALSFLAAGGSAIANLDIEELDAADAWLDRAAAIASDNPTPLRARRLAGWRGAAAAARGDAAGMRQHLERAAELAGEDGGPAARCETLADLAREAGKLGIEQHDPELLRMAEDAATHLLALAPDLTGHPPWAAQADAVLATVALDRGDREHASSFARSALGRMDAANQEDPRLSILLPAARVLRDVGAPGAEDVLGMVGYTAAMIAQRTIDESIRVRWFRGPTGRALTELVGQREMAGAASDDAPRDADQALLQGLVRGQTDAEIATDLGIDEDEVVRRLGGLFSKIGASSRAEATAFAFRERVL